MTNLIVSRSDYMVISDWCCLFYAKIERCPMRLTNRTTLGLQAVLLFLMFFPILVKPLNYLFELKILNLNYLLYTSIALNKLVSMLLLLICFQL